MDYAECPTGIDRLEKDLEASGSTWLFGSYRHGANGQNNDTPGHATLACPQYYTSIL